MSVHAAPYAWLGKFLPACIKWAGMAAFASHHVRLVLRRIFDEARDYASNPCVLPPPVSAGGAASGCASENGG